MRFTRLKILGFKSFVEPTEVVIEPGLTGVVGPNGCGKSNLTEALRWVMGESSYKSMRAGGMDDVIFAGTNARPARNMAEVVLHLDNSARTAPAVFNDADFLEVSRRIEREGGSTYRINGREVRARDVQLLFADASSGARSPALVRQGQIAELIGAKPQSRRRVIEEAAGIAGLHARRHEAELRLKAAEANLERLQDVLQQIASQIEGLKRQARQAARYRGLSGEIRETEATLFYRRFLEAKAQVEEADAALAAETRGVASSTEAQARTATEQANAAFELPGLRDVEARAAASLQRLASAREALDAEERRAVERTRDLERRIVQLEADILRERELASDTDGVLDSLAAEEAGLLAEREGAIAAEGAAKARLDAAEVTVAVAEDELRAATSRAAEANARRNELARALKDTAERSARLQAQLAETEREASLLASETDHELEPLHAAVAAAKVAQTAADAAMLAAEAAHQAARAAEAKARGPVAEAERTAQRLETEVTTLKNLLARGMQGRFRPILDQVKAAKGYEAALGAALGDDLDAPVDAASPLRWTDPPWADGDPELPVGAAPLAPHVVAPTVLARRLAQIGVATRADGPRLAKLLKTGQRLVSLEGDLWRWDGFVSNAEAPSAAARRLAEKNRLAEIEANARAARMALDEEKARFDEIQAEARAGFDAEQAARTGARQAQGEVTRAQDALAAAERKVATAKARLSALAEAKLRIETSLAETIATRQGAELALDALGDGMAIEDELAALQAKVGEDRAELAGASAAHQSLAREAGQRDRRIAGIERDREQWAARLAKADEHVATLGARLSEARTEHESLDGVPGLIREKRLALLSEVDAAESARRAAADRLAEGETRLATADRVTREALSALSSAREARARAEARLEAARARRAEVERNVEDALEMEVSRICEVFGIAPDSDLPPVQTLEGKLDVLRRERERLGAVNLRADEEASEVEAQYQGLVDEKEDLEEAIRRLRTGIGNLNREGRERLMEAFGKVNQHFQKLFTTLFGGGTAELILTESDDPLEAGLDIVARPPGKKPQVLSLLSGGEQALTATALIFAVFLTNPAPICVLDEVDAPLDDHNVERYCDLLNEMVRITDTRFLVITHNPITMARMHRLFGVTMAERGVSQLVSVDLENAERFVEAA